MKTRPRWVHVHRYCGLANTAWPAVVDRIESLSVFFKGLAAVFIPPEVKNDKPLKTARPSRCAESSVLRAQAVARLIDLNAAEINVFGLPYRTLPRFPVTETSLLPDNAYTRD